jgi:hypothetical protein
MDMGKEIIETKGCKLLLDPFHFVGISRHNIITNSSGEFKLRCRVKYDTYRQSREAKEKVMLQTRLQKGACGSAVG